MMQMLVLSQRILMVMGELPFEFEDFFDELTEKDLAGKPFGVVGSGDREYGEFFSVNQRMIFVGAFEKKLVLKKVAETVEIEKQCRRRRHRKC